MPLTLTITSYQNRSAAGNTTTIVEYGSITIGRAPDNDWVLADPEMVLSRKHCHISYKNGDYFLTDTSVNGVFINQSEERLGRGNTVRLNQGDEFTLGDYTIRATIIDGPVQIVSNTHRSVTPLIDEDAETAQYSETINAPPAALANDSNAEIITKPQDQEGHSAKSVSLPEQNNTSANNTSAKAADVATQASNRQPSKTTIDDTPEQSLIPRKTANSDFSESVTEARPPLDFDRISNEINPAALQAFLDGVGIAKLPMKDEALPELMYILGSTLRQTVEGMMEVLRTRSEIKQELKVEKTMLTPVKNNPLKWQPNAEEALYALLGKRGDVWMSPQEAINDGFADIKTHELAMNAGVKAAFKRFLEMFDPENIEQELQESSKLDFLASNRRGKYWEAYKKHYQTIAQASDGEFQDLLNKEIAKAYELQQRQHKKSNKNLIE